MSSVTARQARLRGEPLDNVTRRSRRARPAPRRAADPAAARAGIARAARRDSTSVRIRSSATRSRSAASRSPSRCRHDPIALKLCESSASPDAGTSDRPVSASDEASAIRRLSASAIARRAGLVHLMDDAGDFDEAGGRGGRAAAVAGDELEASRARPHVQRLQDAVLPDRLHQRLDLTRVDRARGVDVARAAAAAPAAPCHATGQLIDVVSVVSHAEAGRKPLTRERILGRERGLEFGVGREAVGTGRRDKRRNAGARTARTRTPGTLGSVGMKTSERSSEARHGWNGVIARPARRCDVEVRAGAEC